MLRGVLRGLYIALFLCFFHVNGQHKLSNKYNLMPWPETIEENNNKIKITKDFSVFITDNSTRVYNASVNFIRRLSDRTGVFFDEGFPTLKNQSATIRIRFENEKKLKLGIDESYKIEVKRSHVDITAKNDIGAIRALQSLIQLVNFDKESFFLQGVTIEDKPRYAWRGLMIDVARHFQPIAVIKRNLEAMASLKMNVFHWHLSDDQGFRLESKVFPKLHQLGSDNQYYTHEQVKDIVRYADKLGIRVVPEIDVPGHASAILTAYPRLGSKKDYSYNIERFAGVFDPTLDPTNPEVYTFLDTLFAEVTMLFPDEYFHIGGDENEGKHWDANKDIQQFMKKNKLETNHDLQTYFNIKLEKILNKYGKKLMGWDEIRTKNMPKTAIIHSWRGVNEGIPKGTLVEAVRNGYQSVLSNDYYIDRMQSVAHHYLFDPIGNESLTKEEEKRVLGGEVTMWSELVTPLTIDSRIWPRTAAIAERFWSSKSVNDVKNMHKRLKVVNAQLEELGLTHLKNREAILRNITKNQNVQSLQVLTKIYEPLKIYTRNKGGTEYKSFSPFTLFADACSVDAEDGLEFNALGKDYIKEPTTLKKEKLVSFFKKWVEGYHQFKNLPINPITKNIANHYEVLYQLSDICINALNNQKITTKEVKELKGYINFLKKPLEDTELVIISTIESLLNKYSKYSKA